MGLDTVELVMNVEDAFNLSISDEDAVRITTVGELTDYVVGQYRLKHRNPDDGCPSARAFYRLRRALTTQTQVARRRVRLNARVGELLPGKEDRRQWKSIASDAGLRLPPNRLFGPRCPEPELTLRGVIERYSRAFVLDAKSNPNEQRVFNQLRAIIAEQMTMDESEIHRHSRFVRDLGMN